MYMYSFVVFIYYVLTRFVSLNITKVAHDYNTQLIIRMYIAVDLGLVNSFDTWHGRSYIVCTYTFRGSLTTSQISHLLLYPSLWLVLSGLSSQFLPLLPIQPAFIVNSGWQCL